jgi:short-subunit dehydrogenase
VIRSNKEIAARQKTTMFRGLPPDLRPEVHIPENDHRRQLSAIPSKRCPGVDHRNHAEIARASRERPAPVRSSKAPQKDGEMTGFGKGTALVTGASSGIGAIYADRLARRGHDLILVARNRERLQVLAERLMDETHSVEVVGANLTEKSDLARVEEILRNDPSITMLVNNAGIGATGPLLESDVDAMEHMIALNVVAAMRLTYAVVPAFVKQGGGAIINIASVVGVAPETLNGVYGASKAFVLAFSLSLHKELAESNIRVQAVLPGATATDFWDIAGTPVSRLPGKVVMKADVMVDAALAGFDQGELVTIPSLPHVADWNAFEAARQKLIPHLSLSAPAARYRTT